MKFEFKQKNGEWDLKPSVYEIEAETRAELHQLLLRVYSEHSASLLERPPRGCSPINTEGAHDPSPTTSPGSTFFSFANSCHREFALGSADELQRLVACLLSEYTIRCQRMVNPSDMLAYASGQLDKKDREWLDFIQTHPNGSKWSKRIEKHRKQTLESQK